MTNPNDDTLADGRPITSIADLAEQDYDGGDNMDVGSARNILQSWMRNSPRARQLIEAMGMTRAIAEYRAAYQAAFENEYDQ